MAKQFILQSNNALSLRAYFLSGAVFSLVIALLALRFVFMSFWLIIPLAKALSHSVRQNKNVQLELI